MKLMIWVGLSLGGLAGGWLGAMLDHGNYLGGWSIIGTAVGSLIGVWIGFKIAQNYL